MDHAGGLASGSGGWKRKSEETAQSEQKRLREEEVLFSDTAPGQVFYLPVKRKNAEVSLKQLSDAERRCFRTSDRLEWESVRQINALEVIPPKVAKGAIMMNRLGKTSATTVV